MGCLSSTFGNSAPKTKTLVNRLNRGVYAVSRRPESAAPRDDRGPVVRTVETAQTFLRRNVPSRRPGLGLDEKAEAVRLARAGFSMRAIGRRMGVDRKAVRVSLVEAGLIVDDPSECP